MSEFYVYAFISKTDNETIRYIGKGKGKRMESDINRRYKVPLKNRKKVATGLTEQEAFILEEFLIALYGRIDLKTGTLTNLTDGGEGASGWIPSKEYRENASKRMAGVPKTAETRQRMTDHLNKMWNSEEGKKRKASLSARMSGENSHRKGIFTCSRDNIRYGRDLNHQGPPRAKGFPYHLDPNRRAPSNIQYGKDIRFQGPPKPYVNSQAGKTGGSNPNARTYIVTDPEGVEHTVHGLTDWCKERGLKPANLRNVLAGKTKQHKGYTIRKP